MGYIGHTGYRTRIRRSQVREVDFEPRRVEVPTGNPYANITGIYNGDEFEGEFQGNSERVLVGLSTLKEFDYDDVFSGAQKGVAIGFTETSTHFSIYTSNGSGTVTTTPLSKFKDNNLHNFIISIYSNKVRVRFDGEENTLTSNIPVFGDALKLVITGIY